MSLTKSQLNQLEEVFKGGSKTYFNSSLFFDLATRAKIIRLYAFVRLADDIVDNLQSKEVKTTNFENFYNLFLLARKNSLAVTDIQSLAISSFVELERELNFDLTWAMAFLSSMRSDIIPPLYLTWEDTNRYIYGSASVIGLFMARILSLPTEADASAQKLGQAMQLINFIRDIKEDLQLCRCYFPQEFLINYGFDDLQSATKQGNTIKFKLLITDLLKIYFDWQNEAQDGFKYIPKNYLIPIKTASDMYLWTAKQIQRNPLVVLKKKLKPTKTRILLAGIQNWILIK